LRGHPNVYEVEDLEGEPVIGKFYEEELSGVDKKDDVYRVEKVLKSKKVRGKKMVLIKWLGYNSWIPESDLQNIRYSIQWLRESSKTSKWKTWKIDTLGMTTRITRNCLVISRNSR
jgi:hypothetical protein